MHGLHDIKGLVQVVCIENDEQRRRNDNAADIKRGQPTVVELLLVISARHLDEQQGSWTLALFSHNWVFDCVIEDLLVDSFDFYLCLTRSILHEVIGNDVCLEVLVTVMHWSESIVATNLLIGVVRTKHTEVKNPFTVMRYSGGIQISTWAFEV